MKKAISWIACLVLMPMLVLAQETDVLEETTTIWDATLKVIAPIVVIAASICANFVAKKPTDKAWVKFVKNLINLFALNLSEKAGK